MSAGIELFNINAQSAAAGIVGADNGLNIDAPHATVVYLGGTLLQDTDIALDGHIFSFSDSDLVSQIGGGAFFFQLINGSTSYGSIAIAGTGWSLIYTVIAGTKQKVLIGNNQADTGITVDDGVDEIGLLGKVDFMTTGGNPIYKTLPKQFVQRSGVPAFIQTFDPQGNSGDVNITSFPVDPAFDWILQLNIYMLITVAGLGVNVNLTYTDIAGNPQTKLVISGVTADSYEGTVITFKAQRGTTVSLDTVTSGSNTYDVGGAFCIINPNL